MDKHNLLHPSLPVKNLKKKDEALLIQGTKNGKFDGVFMNAQFESLPKSMDVPVIELSKFLDSGLCQNLRAVIFILADYNNSSHPIDLEIRQMVYEEVTKRNCHIYLVDPKTISTMTILFSSKIGSKTGDAILNVLSRGENICVSELRREQEGYLYTGDRVFNRFNRNINDVATECLGTCNPDYVIVYDLQGNELVKSLKSTVVPPKKVISIDIEDDRSKYIPQVWKTIIERGHNQIIPFCMNILAVTNESNITAPEQALITVDECEELPLEKVKIIPKSKKSYYVAFLDEISESYKPAGKAQTSKEQEEHRIKIALVVDRNSLPFLYQESYIIPEIDAFPKKLSSSRADLNVPVIGFFDNSSVICVRDENGYKFLNEWNGLHGNDLYLNFEPEEPTIVTDLNKVKSKDPFVVYDLIKLLSMPADDLKADPNWGFKVTSNAENPILLQFETFSGSRQTATPVFMLALLLKHHIKAIKKETGKKPKELGFYLFIEFSAEEKKRIRTGLDEACKLLKIGFVIVSSD